MNFELTTEQQMLAETARAFADRHAGTGARDAWPAMAGVGWPGLLVPEAHGGAAAGVTDLVLVCEALGRGPVASPLIASGVLAAVPLAALGTGDQRARLLPAIASGERIGTLALVEPGMRDEWDGVAMVGGRELSGTKVLVPWATRADVVIVATRDGLCVVERGAPGLEVADHHTLDDEPAGALNFARVSPEALGDPVAGRLVLHRTLDIAAVASLAYAVGAAARALELSVQHATDREQFGRPIGAFQAIAHRCAEMRADLDACRYLAYQAAWALDRSTNGEREVAAALAYSKDAIRRMFRHAHQVHGAIGFSTEHPLHRFTRRAKAFELSFGSASRHRARLAETMGLRSQP